jgi:hypothetical protein
MGVLATYLIALKCFVNGCVDQSMRNWTRDPIPPSVHEVAWVAHHTPPNSRPPTFVKVQSLPGYERRDILGAGVVEPSPVTIGAVQYRAGWPCFAIGGEWTYWVPNATGQYQEFTYGMISFKDKLTYMPRQLRYIPYRPKWPGFALNTLMYGAAFWLLLGLPSAVRRYVRIQRGLCVKCGYDLRKRPSDSSACPECGAAVTPHMLNSA